MRKEKQRSLPKYHVTDPEYVWLESIVMKIQHVLFAERTFVVNGKVMIEGLLPDFLVLNHPPEPDRPSIFGFALLISIVNPEKHFQLSVIIEDHSGNQVAKAEGPVDMDKTAANFRENVNGLTSAAVNVDFRNFPFPSIGDYKFRVRVGDQEVVRTLTVTVVK